MPEGLEGMAKEYFNEENIYITKTTSLPVVKLFQEQFKKDFCLFLKLRHEELVFGGQMVLAFLGRKNEDVFSGDLNHVFGLLAQSLQSLVAKGLVEKEKLDSFYIPNYGPSIGEVRAIVKQSELFDMDHIQLFESNWDPYDDSEGDGVHDSVQSGVNFANCIRAVMESTIASHFGEDILDMLFTEYACRAGNHLKREKTKFAIIVLSLKKRC